jgi:hypothetical protein
MARSADDSETPPRVGELILVEWVDSVSIDEKIWHDQVEVETLNLSVAYTVGQVVREDKDVFIVAGSWTDDQYSGVMCIPRVSIRKLTKMEKP